MSWSLDFVTDLPACGAYNAILTCVDRLTKYTHLIPCFMGEGELGAPEVARLFFDGVVKTFGIPSEIVSDRDPRFTSHFWGELWRLLGCRLALSSAHHP